jgi:hypothetical protein
VTGVVRRRVAGVLAGTIVAGSIAGDARAYFSELATACKSIEAGGPTGNAGTLKNALARVGSNGRTRLDLDRFPLSIETARLMARSPNLAALQSLSLADARVTGPMLKELLVPSAFPALVELDLTNNRFGPADLEALAAVLAGRGIRRLVLGPRQAMPSVDSEGRLQVDEGRGLALKQAGALEALARIAATPSLTVLDLREEKLGVAGVEALLKVTRSSPLEIATRTPASLSRKHMDEVAALDPAGRISFATAELDIGAGALRALDASGLLAKISTLDVNCGDACAKIIAKSPRAGRLREIVFGCEENTPFTKDTAVALAHASALGSLRRLVFLNDVELCKAGGIGAAGIRALAGAPFARSLESLVLEDQNLDNEGWAALANSASFASLKELAGSEWEPFLTRAAARSLLRDGPLAKHLEVLRLMAEGQGWPVEELAKGLKMPKLRVLELPSGEGAGKAWMGFARHPGTHRLEVLNIEPSFDSSGDDDAARKQFQALLRKNLPAGVCLP